jgi:hypothetical protein
MEKETQNFMARFGHVEKQAVRKVSMLREATELVNVLPKMNLVRARELWTKWSAEPAFCTVLCFVKKDGDSFRVDTPLSSALSFYPELAFEMLDKGADFRAAGIGDASFLFCAQRSLHGLDAFEALLQQGADPEDFMIWRWESSDFSSSHLISILLVGGWQKLPFIAKLYKCCAKFDGTVWCPRTGQRILLEDLARQLHLDDAFVRELVHLRRWGCMRQAWIRAVVVGC